ncbi:MAG: hypothetical protein AAGI37_05230 [Planctomycetota bacterium]
MISGGADLVRVPVDLPIDSDSIDFLKRAEKVSLRGMGYFALANFVGHLFDVKPLEVKDSGLVHRVVNGVGGKPFIDRLPLTFASRYLDAVENNGDLAHIWLSVSQFNRFDYIHFEPLMKQIVFDVAGFCRAATEREQAIYFRQIF